MRSLIFAAFLLLVCFSSAHAEQRFPPPEFESGYTLPTTRFPPAPSNVRNYVDVALLFLALVAATYFALCKRSRRHVFIVMMLCLAYFGFYRGGCVCPVGAIQNTTLAIFRSDYRIPLFVAALFLLPIIFTLFFGRTFCAAVCPLGAIQDFVLLRPVRVPRWLAHGLRMLSHVYLVVAVVFAATGCAFIICEYDPFVGFFRLSAKGPMLVLGAAFLGLSVFVGRPYCRFVCPYAVLLRAASRVSRWRVRITPAECVRCGLCEDACPFNAISKPEQAPEPHEARSAKKRLSVFLLISPLIVALGGVLGSWAGPALSGVHPEVRLAKLVRLDQAGALKEMPDEINAFRQSGGSPARVYARAAAVRRKFRIGFTLGGAWMGLVIAVKLIALSVYRTSEDYEADRAWCVACARCYSYCPVQLREERERPGG